MMFSPKVFPFFLVASGSLLPALGSPRISEFLANPNDTTLADEDGQRVDWIEIENTSATSVDLGGYFLTDDPLKVERWTIPAGTTLAGSGYQIIFASRKNRTVAGSELHTDFRLSSAGDYLALLAPDGTVISEFTWTDVPGHPGGISFGELNGEQVFLENPTPGAANVGPEASVGKVLFSQPSQVFNESLEVALSSEIEGMDIFYTLDNSEPTAGNATKYDGPLTFTDSTMLRARLGMGEPPTLLGQVSARYYTVTSEADIPIRFNAGVAKVGDFTSDLPIVVINGFGGAIIDQDELVTTSVSLIEPVDGVASIRGVPAVSTRAGIRIRGESSANFDKKQYRIETRNQEDEDKNVSFLDLPADSDWAFGAPFVDKALIRNSLTYELGREIGMDAPRTRHVEVFLNQNGGPLSYSSDYVGVYVITELNRISNDRVDIEKLTPTDNAEPEVTGGYLMSFEGAAADPASTLPGWNTLELQDPDPEVEATMEQKQWIANYLTAADNAVKTDDFTSSLRTYPDFFDLPSYFNLFCINELGRDQDSYTRSSFLYKDRGGKLVMGPLWDYNLFMGTGGFRNNEFAVPRSIDTGWQFRENNGVSETNWEVRLVEDPDFWQGFVDRWQELRSGVLNTNALHARIDDHSRPLGSAAVRNFGKWNNLRAPQIGAFSTPRSLTWKSQIGLMKQWVKDRVNWIDSQFVPLPNVWPSSSVVSTGSSAVLDGAQGVLYYTTDGTDPRLPGGEVRDGALSYQTVPPVEISAIAEASEGWTFLDDGSDQGSSEIVFSHPDYGAMNWKHPGFDDSAWQSGPAPLGFGETIIATQTSPGSPRHFTTYFRRDFQVSDAASLIGALAEVQFDDGVIVYLNGVEVIRANMDTGPISFDSPASLPRNSSRESVWDDHFIHPALLHDGQNTIAIEVHQDTATSNDLRMDFRLTLRQAGGLLPELILNETTVLKARIKEGDNWSGLQTVTLVVGNGAAAEKLVISELHYHPQDATPDEEAAGFTNQDDFEFLELYNTSSEPLDLTGATFTNGIDFEFPRGTMIPARARVLLVRNQAAFQQRYPTVPEAAILGEFANGTGLSNSGERITLTAVDGSILHSLRYRDTAPWPVEADGSGASLVLLLPYAIPDHDQATSWRVSQTVHGNPTITDGSTFPGGGDDELLAYAAQSVNPSASRLPSGDLSFEFVVNPAADDIVGRLEMSQDLVTWEPAFGFFGRAEIQSTEAGATINYHTRVSPSELPIFLRYVFQE